MFDKTKITPNLHKAFDPMSFESVMSSYRSLDTGFSAIYLDYTLFTVPYESLKDSYDSINSSYHSLLKPFSDLFIDFSALNTPYESLNTGYDSLIKD